MRKISVLMSIYNEPTGWINESLTSLVNQDIEGYNIQIVVVIDKPSRRDEILELVYNLKDKYRIRDNIEFVVHFNISNLGLAKSINIAYHLSDGELIARMDADDISLTNRFREQVHFLESTGADLIGAGIERIDKDGKSLGYSKLPSNFTILRNMLGYKSIAYHPTWLLKREVFRKIEGYRPYPNSQDLDFIIRAIEAGFVISNADSILLKYRLNENSLSFLKSLRQRKCQEHILNLHKIRLRGFEDRFDEKEMLSSIKSSKTYERIHAHSQSMYVKGMNLVRNKNYIGMLYIIFSMCISPMQAKYLTRLIIKKSIYEKK